MGNDITDLVTAKMNSVPATTENNPYLDYGRAVTARTIVGDILKFSKQGEWLLGKDEEELAIGTKVIAHVPQSLIGWVKWVDKVAVDHKMGLLREGFRPEGRAALGDLDKTEWEDDGTGRPRDPWQRVNYIPMREVAGEKRLCTYAPSSKSGLTCAGLLFVTFGEALPRKPGQLPVVALGRDSYRHKEYGKIMIPTLKVASWVDEAAFGDLPEGGDTIVEEGDDDIPFP